MDGDTFEGPAVRQGDRTELLLGFREGDIEHGLAAFGGRHEELQRERGLPGARHALDQEQATSGEAPAEHLVEARNTGGGDGAPIGRLWR